MRASNENEMTTDGDALEQRIRERAYELFLRRAEAGLCGDEQADWLAAEAELAGEPESR